MGIVCNFKVREDNQVNDRISRATYTMNYNSFKNILNCYNAAYPDIVVEEMTPDHEFLVMACDGIWDVLTNEEVVEFIRARIAQGMEPEIVSTVPIFFQKFKFLNGN